MVFLMTEDDTKRLDEVVKELGIEDDHITPAEAVRELKAENERLRGGELSYSCPNRCDDYQNIRTRNPFANCGRCGSRLRPTVRRVDEDSEVERLRGCLRAIMRATVEGRVCDDVAWFDSITTLHDFCDLSLNPPKAP